MSRCWWRKWNHSTVLFPDLAVKDCNTPCFLFVCIYSLGYLLLQSSKQTYISLWLFPIALYLIYHLVCVIVIVSIALVDTGFWKSNFLYKLFHDNVLCHGMHCDCHVEWKWIYLFYLLLLFIVVIFHTRWQNCSTSYDLDCMKMDDFLMLLKYFTILCELWRLLAKQGWYNYIF